VTVSAEYLAWSSAQFHSTANEEI